MRKPEGITTKKAAIRIKKNFFIIFDLKIIGIFATFDDYILYWHDMISYLFGVLCGFVGINVFLI